jgi:hypothetical protein
MSILSFVLVTISIWILAVAEVLVIAHVHPHPAIAAANGAKPTPWLPRPSQPPPYPNEKLGANSSGMPSFSLSCLISSLALAMPL